MVGGATACTPAPPRADVAARALAAALTAGDVGDITFAGTPGAQAQRELVGIVEPLTGVGRSVRVTRTVVDQDGDHKGERATALLAYTWQVAPKPWTYVTTATLDLVRPKGGGARTWAAHWAPDIVVPTLAAGYRLAMTRTWAKRADILGGDGTALVQERPVLRIGVDKTLVDAARWEPAARALAAVVGIDADQYARSVAATGRKAFVPAITVRESDPGGVDIAAAEVIEGVAVLPDVLPLAPTRDFARPILGRVGPATAELVAASEGRIRAGDVVGLSGLQRTYDEQLRGTSGVLIRIVPAQSGTAAEPVDVYRSEPVPGTPLRVTLAESAQLQAENLLADQTSPSAVVAIRPSTGEVLVAASGTASDGFSTALLGSYAPGSTFKVATALAMLRTGTTPTTTVQCPATIRAGGRAFRNVPDYPASALGAISLRTAFAHSCNTAMIGQAGAVTQAALHDAASDLGLGASASIGVPAFVGSVPRSGSVVEHAASMLGQGTVTASPFAMAVVAASVAAGRRVAPVLVRPDAEPASRAVPAGPAGLTADEAVMLRDLMRAVVTDGTGTVLAGLSPPVAAKTGTAEFGDGTAAHAWMIAIQGDLAVCVFVERGEHGSTTAGPILRAFLARAGGPDPVLPR